MTNPRRAFLSDLGMGVTGMALGAMLADDGVVRAAESGGFVPAPTQFAPRAKSVIWIFLSGGYSHMETFDPKPALNKYAGMTFDKTPFDNPVNSPLHKKRFRSVPSEDQCPRRLPDDLSYAGGLEKTRLLRHRDDGLVAPPFEMCG